MTNENRDYLEMAFRSIECFANDGTLKVDAKPAAGTVELTLSGAMDYAPSDEPYKVELSGTVTATECVIP